MLDRCCFLGWSSTWKSGVYPFFEPSDTFPFYAASTKHLGHYCSYKKHANSEVQKLLLRMHFLLPSILITITSNKPWNRETHKVDWSPPITNHKPWPFEPVKVNFCFLRGRLRCLTATKSANVSWLLNVRICVFLKSAVKLTKKVSLGARLGSGCIKGGRAYSAKREHCLGGNHGNQTSTNHLAPSHWKSSWNTNYVPQPKGEGEEWEQNQQISQAMNSNDPQRSAKKSKAELLWYAITCQTKHPPVTSLPAWGSTADMLALFRG